MKQRAFSLVEVFVVVVVLALLLVAIILPAMFKANSRSSRASCSNNLKQLCLAFRTWSTDNNDLYPMSYYTNSSGAMQFANASNLFRNFLVMSNEINNPQIVLCPSDMTRTNAWAFDSTFSGSNISYFVGLDADETYPARVLSGDRNINNGTALQSGVLYLTAVTPPSWTKSEQHQGRGNIGLSDGSVRQTSDRDLRAILTTTGLATNRLGMP